MKRHVGIGAVLGTPSPLATGSTQTESRPENPRRNFPARIIERQSLEKRFGDEVGSKYDLGLASQAFATALPERAAAWAGSRPEDATARLEADTGTYQGVWLESLSRRTFDELTPVDGAVIERQQAAETLAEVGLVPEPFTVASNVWTWGQAEVSR